MDTAFPKSGIMVAIALVMGFVAGSYFTDRGKSSRQATDAGSSDVHGEVEEERPKSLLLLSHAARPQAAEVATTAGAREIPPELLIRLTNGEYVLQYEFLTARLGLSNHVAVNVREYRPVIDREYDALFKNLGLDETVAAKAKNHLATIQHARVEAEAYLIQLDEAKVAYDEQMRQLLGPEQYRACRETESARPAVRELLSIKDFLEQAGDFALAAPEEVNLLEALKRSKRIPVYDGPYGEGAHASAGRGKVLANLMEEMNLLRAEYGEIERNSSETGVSGDLRSKVNDYYVEQMRKKQDEIDRLTSAQ